MAEDRANPENGYILLSRELVDSRLWSLGAQHVQVAILLILWANHSTKVQKLPTCDVAQGEVVTSYARIAKTCAHWENRTMHEYDRARARRIILDLIKIGFVERIANRDGTHLKICNYKHFQSPQNYKSNNPATTVQQPCNNPATTLQQPRHHSITLITLTILIQKYCPAWVVMIGSKRKQCHRDSPSSGKCTR